MQKKLLCILTSLLFIVPCYGSNAGYDAIFFKGLASARAMFEKNKNSATYTVKKDIEALAAYKQMADTAFVASGKNIKLTENQVKNYKTWFNTSGAIGADAITGGAESEALKKTLLAMKEKTTPVDKFFVIMQDDMVGGAALNAVETDKTGDKTKLKAIKDRIAGL